ncbi:hypothetical protein Saso_20340 [Streptomyces asoensis]|uniref:Uncharacterized protein n=2 Tax=Streptomyces TaxID=1883 RepID=A0ABQ3RWY7_9ACTN|nr:hypothetical protein GCM10010496_12930 [Streptomyces asoensis]GHI60384.1 hypothetical protein Saso_20340 [Streptomyces asoensis]
MSGNAKSMSEPNRKTSEESATKRVTASKARRTADKATAPASRAAKTAAAKTDGAASATRAGVQRSAEVTTGAVQSAAHSASRGVEASRQAIVATSGQVAATAKTAWTVIAHRKLIAAGVGAGLSALTAASYAVGRRSARHTHGPLTRLTGGRI